MSTTGQLKLELGIRAKIENLLQLGNSREIAEFLEIPLESAETACHFWQEIQQGFFAVVEKRYDSEAVLEIGAVVEHAETRTVECLLTLATHK